jgi:hypothetical protein
MVAGLDFGGGAGRAEFLQRDAALAFQADIDDGVFVGEPDDAASDDGAVEAGIPAEGLVKKGSEVFAARVLVGREGSRCHAGCVFRCRVRAAGGSGVPRYQCVRIPDAEGHGLPAKPIGGPSCTIARDNGEMAGWRGEVKLRRVTSRGVQPPISEDSVAGAAGVSCVAMFSSGGGEERRSGLTPGGIGMSSVNGGMTFEGILNSVIGVVPSAR